MEGSLKPESMPTLCRTALLTPKLRVFLAVTYATYGWVGRESYIYNSYRYKNNASGLNTFSYFVFSWVGVLNETENVTTGRVIKGETRTFCPNFPILKISHGIVYDPPRREAH